MRKVLVAVLALLPVAASLHAQEWSAEQKEVWKNVEAYTALLPPELLRLGDR
jgi:hypothetical protein